MAFGYVHMREVVDCEKFFILFKIFKTATVKCRQIFFYEHMCCRIYANEQKCSFDLCQHWTVVLFANCADSCIPSKMSLIIYYSLQFMFYKHIEGSLERFQKLLTADQYPVFPYKSIQVVPWRYNCHSLQQSVYVGTINTLKIVVSHVSKLVFIPTIITNIM